MSDTPRPVAPTAARPDSTKKGRAPTGSAAVLQQSTARALDSISEGLVIVDRGGRFVYVNPAAEQFMRKPAAEVLGQTLRQIFPDAVDRTFGIEYRRAVAENVPVHFEEFYPEPQSAWYEVRVYPGPEGSSIFFRDVTARREVEAALRQSEERYRTILQTAMDGFWMADAQGRLLEVNEAYCRMSGYSAQELLAMRIPDLEAVETAEETAARIQAVIARGEGRFESRHRRKDGSTFDVDVSVKYWSAGDGRFIGFLRDVTGRKQVEAALQERIKEMNCLYSVGDLIDREADLEKILQGTAERMPHGWCHSDIACARIAVDGQDVQTPNFRETAWRQAADIVVHGRPAGTVELRYLEERPLRDEGPFFREERSLIDAIAERLGRVVERVRAEAALRESEERHRTILLTALDGFWLVDLHGRLLEVNDAYCRLSGYSAQELLAMRIPDLEAVETPAEVAARIQALAARGDERFESRHRRKDGSTFDVEVSVKYWSAGDGRFVVFLRDVSDRKLAERQLDGARADVLTEKTRLEEVARSLSASEAELQRANQGLQAANEALRRSNETLEARVAERTADLFRRTAQLQALAQDLTRAEERERQRVAQVIHDHLQQLLSVARMNLGMVLDRVRTKSVKQSLGSLDGLIAESLDLTRSLTAELSPAILHRSGLAAALQWLGRWYEERFGLKVAVDTEADVELGEELRVTIFRGVRELLFNVVKHANVANAGVQLRRAADGSTRVVVRDEGVGFDPETMRAWDGGPGHGFGLFSLRERLELLGGRLHVDSAPGQGASFTIIGPPPSPERPRTPSTPPAAPLKAAAPKQTGGRHGRPARRRKR